jgi:ATPase family associated with various cellular activities (AAA)
MSLPVARSLAEELEEMSRAMLTGIWVETFEPEDALKDLATAAKETGGKILQWDLHRGTEKVLFDKAQITFEPVSGARSLDQALDQLEKLNDNAGKRDSEREVAYLVVKNIHLALVPPLIQRLANMIWLGREKRHIIVVFSPVVRIPIELEKLFTVVEHKLPDRAALTRLAEGVAGPDELPETDEFERVLDAASGMTRIEAENAFSLSVIRHGKLDRDAVFSMKAQVFKRGLAGLSLYEGPENFASIGGHAWLKEFTSKLLAKREENPKFRPRGIICTGVSGGGKSLFCKALGAEVGRPVLTLDVGGLMGGIVGQTEGNTRRAFQVVDAGPPSILMAE